MDLRSQLIRDEGVELTPYRDSVGKLTIGVGRNLEDVGISRAEADYLLDNDIARAKIALNQALPWTANLDAVRRAVFINMVFNMGLGNSERGLLSFRNTLAAAERREWGVVAAGMRASKWARQVGDRAERLARQIETGEWQ